MSLGREKMTEGQQEKWKREREEWERTKYKEHVDSTEKMTEQTCPFNHKRMCPHILSSQEWIPRLIWCQVCILTEIFGEIKLLRATQS